MFELFIMVCLLGISLSQLLPEKKNEDDSGSRKANDLRDAQYRSDRHSRTKRGPVRRYQRQADSARTPVNSSGGIGRQK